MAYLMVRTKVADFAKWKSIFDEHSTTRRHNGSKGGFFFTNKRLIGISYSRITLVAYLIPFGIVMLWLSILLPLVAWGVQVDPMDSHCGFRPMS